MFASKKYITISFAVFALAFLAGCKPGTKTKAEFDACMKSCLAEHQCDMAFAGNPHTLGSQCLIVQNDCEAKCEGHSSSANAFTDEMKNRVPVTLPLPINGSTTNALAQRGPFGAIAYSKESNSWGASAPSADKKAAEKSAMSFCLQRGPGCAVVDSFSHACAAVATGAHNILMWAHASNAAAARVKAQRECVNKSNDSCAVQFWECYPDTLEKTGKAGKAVGTPK